MGDNSWAKIMDKMHMPCTGKELAGHCTLFAMTSSDWETTPWVEKQQKLMCKILVQQEWEALRTWIVRTVVIWSSKPVAGPVALNVFNFWQT